MTADSLRLMKASGGLTSWADYLRQRWAQLLVSVLALILAVALGWVASAGNLIVGTVALGAMVVACLMFMPRLSVWLILVVPLWSGGILALLGPAGSKATWIVAVLSVILLAASLVKLAWHKEAPNYVWAVLLLMAYAVSVSIVNGISFEQLLAGFKRYFQAYGLMFALALLPFAAGQLGAWRKSFFWLAFAQLPMCLFQLGVLVPLRGGFAQGGEVTDVVAGTFGGNLHGGSNNSDLVFFLVMALGFLLAHAQERGLRWRQLLVPLLIIAAPIVMGETKIAVLLIPICLLSVYTSGVHVSVLRLLMALMLGGVLVFGLALLYAEVLMGQTLDFVVQDTIRYNFQEVGYGNYLLNRWTVLLFWWDNHSVFNLQSLLFGHGLSSSYSSVNLHDNGHVAVNYPGFGIDLTAASAVLWDLGLIGLFIFMSIFFFAIKSATRLAKSSPSATVRSEALGVRTGLVLLLFYIPYNNSLVNLVTTEVMFAALLGYLAYLLRSNERN